MSEPHTHIAKRLQEVVTHRLEAPLSQLQNEIERQVSRAISSAGRQLLAEAAQCASEQFALFYETVANEIISQGNSRRPRRKSGSDNLFGSYGSEMTEGTLQTEDSDPKCGGSLQTSPAASPCWRQAIAMNPSCSVTLDYEEDSDPKCGGSIPTSPAALPSFHQAIAMRPSCSVSLDYEDPPTPPGDEKKCKRQGSINRQGFKPPSLDLAMVKNSFRYASNGSGQSTMTDEDDGNRDSPRPYHSDYSDERSPTSIRNSQVTPNGSRLVGRMKRVGSLIVASNRMKSSGPSSLPLLSMWRPDSTSRRKRSSRRISVTSEVSEASASIMTIRSGDVVTDQSWFQWCILNPSGLSCVLWDLFTTIAVFYDLVVIPLQAFDVELKTVDVVVTCIWVVDIALSFLKGYQNEDQNVVEMRPTKIALRYLRSWFAFDFLIVAMDLVFLIVEGESELKILILVRVLRLMRLLRLVRILKLSSRLRTFAELLQIENLTEKWSAVAGILMLLVVLLCLNHFSACGWYAMGTLDEVSGLRWVDVNFNGAHAIGYRYTTSFHWSMTQFTPASMEVYPVNVVERLYSVFIICCGLLMFSSFVSTITQSMANLRNLNAEQRKADTIVRRYIAENRVSTSLASAIVGFLKTHKEYLRHRSHHEQDIKVFKFLPHKILHQMREEVYGPVLQTHGLFVHIQQNDDIIFQSICHHVMAGRSLLHGEELFHVHMASAEMYFVTGGSFHYLFEDHEAVIVEPSSSSNEDQTPSRMCEAAIWTQWETRGRAVCMSRSSDLINLHVAEFQRRAMKSNVVFELRKYAKLFATRAVASAGAFDQVTDVWGSTKIMRDMADCAFRTDLEEMEVAARTIMVGFAVINVKSVFDAWKEYALNTYKVRWWLRCCPCLRLRCCPCLRRNASEDEDSNPHGIKSKKGAIIERWRARAFSRASSVESSP